MFAHYEVLLEGSLAFNAVLTPMRRFIAQLLALSILFAGVAWAADAHAEAFFGHDINVPSLGGDLPDDFSDDGSCDHCCHGTAHYLGLLLTSSAVVADTDGRVTVLPVVSYHSRANAPPTQPPKS